MKNGSRAAGVATASKHLAPPSRTAQPHPKDFSLFSSSKTYFGARRSCALAVQHVLSVAKALISMFDGALWARRDAWRTEAPEGAALRGRCKRKRLGQDRSSHQTLTALR